MNLKVRRLLWILPLFLLLVFGLLSVIASAWLESSGGRQLVQNALSSSLGLPVQLAGDYNLRLIPSIRFTGTQLHLNHPAGDAPFAGSEAFSAEIEWAPFIRKEIRIASIRLNKGFLDLARLPESLDEASFAPQSKMELPRVRLVQLDDFLVTLSGWDQQIHLNHLRLEDFVPGEEAGLEFKVSLTGDQGQRGSLSGNSLLRVHPEDFSLAVQLEGVDFSWGDASVAGLKGKLDWNAAKGQLEADLAWPAEGAVATLQLEVAAFPISGGILRLNYPHSPPSPPSSLEARFTWEEDLVGLEFMQLAVAGQQISGRGCIVLAEKPLLNLMLESEELNVDEIYRLVPDSGDSTSELPVEPAIHLKAGTARYSGAEATALDVHIGAAPDCGGLVFPLQVP